MGQSSCFLGAGKGSLQTRWHGLGRGQGKGWLNHDCHREHEDTQRLRFSSRRTIHRWTKRNSLPASVAWRGRPLCLLLLPQILPALGLMTVTVSETATWEKSVVVVVGGGGLRHSGCVTAADPLLKRKLFPHLISGELPKLLALLRKYVNRPWYFLFLLMCCVLGLSLENNSRSFMLVKGSKPEESAAPSQGTPDLPWEGISPVRMRQPADSSWEAFTVWSPHSPWLRPHALHGELTAGVQSGEDSQTASAGHNVPREVGEPGPGGCAPERTLEPEPGSHTWTWFKVQNWLRCLPGPGQKQGRASPDDTTRHCAGSGPFWARAARPWGLRQRRIGLQWRRPGLGPWVQTIPWRRAWQPTPVFLPREFHGQRILVGLCSWGRKESDRTERLILFPCHCVGPTTCGH